MVLFFKFLVYNNGNIFIWGSEIVKLALNAPMPVRTKGLVNSFHNLKEIRLTVLECLAPNLGTFKRKNQILNGSKLPLHI